ncbi:unnamed protein product [Adineta steineri]|uniref:ABC transporter domain-containing protein n=2 Tax=Adineta steineri TaxID=433720 RepID=A0A814H579_9BILA|nr:unnamed protein product [Adineta steineri]
MAGMSKLPAIYRHGFVLATSMAVSYWMTVKWLRQRSKQLLEKDINSSMKSHVAKKNQSVAVDKRFFRNLIALLKILVPKIFCGESLFLALVAASLIARTYADVWMIKNSTSVESAIIGRNVPLFKENLARFAYAMPLIAFVNNALRYTLEELKLRFRKRLSLYLYDQYLKGFTYYQVNTLDSRINNIDQLLTQDVEKFCSSVADLYTNISKPFLDIIIYARKLSGSIGPGGPSLLVLYLVCSGLVLTRLRRPIGRMTVAEQQFEGEFRYVNSRLITNCEEIAFYNGSRREKMIIRDGFERLIKHLRSLIIFRLVMGCIDSVVAKYISTCVGYYVVSRPFLDPLNTRHANSTYNQILEDYYSSGRMLMRLAEAVGRLVLAGRELTKLAGFTTRVTDLIGVLSDVNQGNCVRTGINNTTMGNRNDQGQIRTQDGIIKFENVKLMTPNGDVLIENLNFTVRSGQNVIVVGPNGCGKSSLFRTIGELWPIASGTLTKPGSGHLFYIPQKPYMIIGTLRDQIIYPDSHGDMHRKGVKDENLRELLDKVQLTYLTQREGGLSGVQDWMDVLSGGEKQRIAMARLFYHKPQFAILDECTSAVSVDVEGFMYEYCRNAGITLFTVSHRKSLWKYHEYCLYMDGRGSYTYTKIDEHTSEFGPPLVAILDEPTTGVDPNARQQMQEIFLNAVKAKLTIILTSHSMDECERVCNRLGIMVRGQLACLGTIQHLKSKFGRGYTIEIKVHTIPGDTNAMVIQNVQRFLLSQRQYQIEVKETTHSTGLFQCGQSTPAELFQLLEENKQQLHIETYTISQTTLEQIFLSFGKQIQTSTDE